MTTKRKTLNKPLKQKSNNLFSDSLKILLIGLMILFGVSLVSNSHAQETCYTNCVTTTDGGQMCQTQCNDPSAGFDKFSQNEDNNND